MKTKTIVLAICLSPFGCPGLELYLYASTWCCSPYPISVLRSLVPHCLRKLMLGPWHVTLQILIVHWIYLFWSSWYIIYACCLITQCMCCVVFIENVLLAGGMFENTLRSNASWLLLFLGLFQYNDDHRDETEDDGEWEYVEDGPAEIIWQGNEIIVKKKKVKIPKKAEDKPLSQEVKLMFVIKFCCLFTVSQGSSFWLTVWKGHVQCLAGRETYIKSAATSVCSCCFSEERTFLVCSRTAWESCSRDSKFRNWTGILHGSLFSWTGKDVLLLQNIGRQNPNI